MPADTMFLLKISNLAQVLEDMEENPVLSLWERDELQEYFEPIIRQMEKTFVSINLKEELGLEDNQLKEMFPGQMIFAMTDFDFKNLKRDNVPGNYVGLVEFKGDIEIIDKLIRHSLETSQDSVNNKAKVFEDEFLGAKIWMLEEKDGSEVEEDGILEKGEEIWAVFDNVLMVATSLQRVRETISLLDGDTPENSITAASTYSRMTDDGAESELFFYLNLRSLFTLLKSDVLNESQSAEPNMMAISRQSLWQALAPEAMDGIYVAVDTNHQDPIIYSGFLFSDKRGIPSLLTYGKGDISKPAYISKEVMSARVTLFSLKEFWRNLEGLSHP